jgi:uncharacterized protein YecE (DUF72 family)
MAPTTGFDREALKRRVGELADEGVLIGTSSWKYAGWRGLLYDEARYVFRGRFSESRFERLCLAEYAEVFKTVSVDAAYYKFPDRHWLEQMVSLTPPDFQFALKVTDEITTKRFASIPRLGRRAGQENSNFLNTDLFASAFLGPCEAFRRNIGLVMFEFSHFSTTDFEHGREFVAALDAFLARLPGGWPYGVEIRNTAFLHPDYFAALTRHGVTHIFNSWERMPPVQEQLALGGAKTTPDRLVARFLLRPGRRYEEAVKLFTPYDSLKEPYEEGRAAAVTLVKETRRSRGKTRAFIFVNNRFEGNALETINAILAATGDDF